MINVDESFDTLLCVPLIYSWVHLGLFIYLFKDFTYLFLVGGEGKEKGRGTSVCGCLLHARYWGPGLQPKHVPWLGNKPTTLWFAGQHSIHSATPASAGAILSGSCSLWQVPFLVLCLCFSPWEFSLALCEAVTEARDLTFPRATPCLWEIEVREYILLLFHPLELYFLPWKEDKW